MKNKNENNFNKPAQIAAGDIINSTVDKETKRATYTPEPIWRSPITIAILSCISAAIAIVGLFPASKIVNGIVATFNGIYEILISAEISMYVMLLMSFMLLFKLRRIIKN